MLTTEPQDWTVTSVGDVAVFSCQLPGSPTPRTVWYHQNQVITATDDNPRYVLLHDDSTALSVLQVHTASQDDAGFFRCKAGNGVEQPVFSRSARLSFNASASAINSCMFLLVPFVTLTV